MKIASKLFLAAIAGPWLLSNINFAQPTYLRAGDAVIPLQRRAQWTPGLGKPIPTYPIAVNVKNAPFNAVGDGIADDYSAITNAIAACTNGGAVFFPVGTYRITNQIQIKNRNIVLRGSGASTKLLLLDQSSTVGGAIEFRGASGSKVPLLSGYDQRSAVLTLGSTSAFVVGDVVRIEQDNDPQILEGNIPGGSTNTSTFYMGQYNTIVAKSPTTVTLLRPLYNTYTAVLNPRLQRMVMTTDCGVEDLMVDQEGTRDSTISFFQSARSWVRGVESTNANWHHVMFDRSYACEARSNYVHHAKTYGQGGYGFDMNLSTDCLVEDNMMYYLRHSAIIQNGSSGNVVGYNYSHRIFDAQYPNTDYLLADIECHGGHPSMNLIEGNVCAKITSDNYWGSSRNNTVLRNWIQRYSDGETKSITVALWAVEVERAQLYANIVGNVFCRPGVTGAITQFGNSSYTTDLLYDDRVTNTIIFHGNFDYVSGRTQWDSNIQSHYIPPSLYYADKPAFFGSLDWPPFGPTPDGGSIVVKTIPALARWISRFGNP